MGETTTTAEAPTPPEAPTAIHLELDVVKGRLVVTPAHRVPQRTPAPPLTEAQLARCDAAAHALFRTAPGELLRELASGHRVIYRVADQVEPPKVV